MSMMLAQNSADADKDDVETGAVDEVAGEVQEELRELPTHQGRDPCGGLYQRLPVHFGGLGPRSLVVAVGSLQAGTRS